jgi:hypothetical protein
MIMAATTMAPTGSNHAYPNRAPKIPPGVNRNQGHRRRTENDNGRGRVGAVMPSVCNQNRALCALANTICPLKQSFLGDNHAEGEPKRTGIQQKIGWQCRRRVSICRSRQQFYGVRDDADGARG